MRPICVTCGTQYREVGEAPERCPICEDERQFVGWAGQQWTDLAALGQDHRVEIADDHGLLGFEIRPHFGIGQRALLVESPAGNILWDCLSLVDRPAIEAIRERGGLAGIAISHPHFYSSMVAWSEAFGDVPIHLHADDSEWVQHPNPSIRPWAGETFEPLPGVALIRCGGHFAGGTVMHRAAGEGDLLVGDVLQVCQDRRWLSFMRSYPNYIPLNAAAVGRIGSALSPYRYRRVYGAFRGRVVPEDGMGAVRRSIERYLLAIA